MTRKSNCIWLNNEKPQCRSGTEDEILLNRLKCDSQNIKTCKKLEYCSYSKNFKKCYPNNKDEGDFCNELGIKQCKRVQKKRLCSYNIKTKECIKPYMLKG